MKEAKSYIITFLGILLFVLGLYQLKTAVEPSGIMKTLPYFCVGIGCGLLGHGLGEIIGKKARKSDPELAKRLEIEEKDERNVTHANASKARGFEMMTYVFAALMLAYGLMGTSFHVLLPFVTAYLFVQFYALYHRFKLDREE